MSKSVWTSVRARPVTNILALGPVTGLLGVWGLLLLAATPAAAHTLKHRLGNYQDSSGLSRQRVGFDATVESKPGLSGLSDASVNLQVLRDRYVDGTAADEDDEYLRRVYGESERINDAATVSANQTWGRLTETRVLGSYATDGKVRLRSWAGGASQWFAHESLRVGLDVSRTVVEQPLYQVLDYDSEQIGNPTVASSVGTTLAARHLATSTTLMDYTLSRVEYENRPVMLAGSVAARQFVPPLDGAVHGGVTRAVNRGTVTTATTYGEVDAWIGDLAYLQNLWRGGRARVGYRYYKESETTRAYGDRRQLGSDTTTLALAQDLDKRQVDNLAVPLTIEASASRYANNDGIAAWTYELGVTARF